VKKSYSVPFVGSTTTTFPIVWSIAEVDTIFSGALHVCP
jgi:hypothetical protein